MFKFSGSRARQRPAHFENGFRSVLEASFNGGRFRVIGLSIKVMLSNAEPVELNGTV